MIPKEYIPAIDAGIQGAMQAGVLAGYPVVDVKVHLTFGSYHEVDSSEMAFKIAGSMAFKEACRKADAILLEPVMKVSVIVPDEYLGNVIGDLTSRRGMIQGQESRPGATQVDALVPLASMFATPLTYAPPPRAAASTPWSPTAMWRSPRASRKRSSPSAAAARSNFPAKNRVGLGKWACNCSRNRIKYLRHDLPVSHNVYYRNIRRKFQWLSRNSSVLSPMSTSAPSAR